MAYASQPVTPRFLDKRGNLCVSFSEVELYMIYKMYGCRLIALLNFSRNSNVNRPGFHIIVVHIGQL